MEDEDELLDLVDSSDRVTATVKRTFYYAQEKKPIGYLRSAELFICNDKNQLWIPRRTADKKVAPGGLDYSCGGHVSSGEDYLTTILREAQEELNLKIDPKSLIFLQKFYPTNNEPWFKYLYLYKYNEAPDYNRSDFQAYYWLTSLQLLDKLEAGEPAKSSMLMTLKSVIDRLSYDA